MRVLGVSAALVLTIAVGGVGVGVGSGTALADDHGAPSKQDVRAAQADALHAADDVAGVQAQLVVADQRLQESSVVAAQAAEAYNGARWRAAQARKAASAAQQRAETAVVDVQRQRDAYSGAIVRSYELAPGLTTLAAIVHSDGIETVAEHAATLDAAEGALGGQYDEFRAASTLAQVASDQAAAAQDDAEQAAQDALAAQRSAQGAADRAAAEAQQIADQKATLVARLADLQHISVSLAQQRQSDLERRAARAAARAAAREAKAAAQQEAQQEADQEAAQEKPEATEQPTEQPSPASSEPAAPEPSDDPEPATPPAPAAPASATPAPSGGATAAIAFARSQIGDPYVWGAAGPSSWDCSGLTMGAWRAGGVTLPHYSVAQYEQSTPIAASQLRPGDLVFWGSSSDPSSIYHVALYVGGGRIIHAPRTGEDVQETSMYYWITPNFYARP